MVRWKSEKTLQQAVSRFLTDLVSDGHVKPGLTLHGLRVTLAAEFKRQGEHDGIVSDILGDKSEKMGRHYIHDRKGLWH
jgi:hypothetical protein